MAITQAQIDKLRMLIEQRENKFRLMENANSDYRTVCEELRNHIESLKEK